MAKSIERQIKDAVISRLESLPDTNSVDTSGRGRIVSESDIESGKPAVFVSFPEAKKEGGCGFLKIIFPVRIEARFRFDGDVDSLDTQMVRDALDRFEQDVYAAINEDTTWGNLAFDTRYQDSDLAPFKVTSEDVNVPEATVILNYEIELHHTTTDPNSTF